MITQKELWKLLLYDAIRGVFTWRVARRRAQAGAIAGCVHSNGYRFIKVIGRIYLASRLAFLYIRGYFPENDVDHINRVRDDDRWCNLREVSRSCNMRNTGNLCTNTSGVKGVSWYKPTQKWRAQIRVPGSSRHLGYFDDFTEAVAHRLAAEQCLDWSGCDSSSSAFQYIQNYLSNRTFWLPRSLH